MCVRELDNQRAIRFVQLRPAICTPHILLAPLCKASLSTRRQRAIKRLHLPYHWRGTICTGRRGRRHKKHMSPPLSRAAACTVSLQPVGFSPLSGRRYIRHYIYTLSYTQMLHAHSIAHIANISSSQSHRPPKGRTAPDSPLPIAT